MNDVTRSDVEDFLYHEAELLDSWQLEAWRALFLPDSHYLVPSLAEPDLGPSDSLYLVNDDFRRITTRVNQYLSGSFWVENPFSKVQRLVTNVRIISQQQGELVVCANFSVSRYYKGRTADTYVGQYRYVLLKSDSGFNIKEKKATLALDVLRPQGKLSIIL
jgi:p-cumate 2,3-dioxygenase beta subunit